MKRLALLDPYRLLLVGLMTVYVGVFGGLALAQHAGMRTHKADLGQMDQAIWNSSRGRFVESTDYGYIASRLTDHVEPILALISPIFWVWDDVRALLILQAVVVALGAWPLYGLALLLLDRTLPAAAQSHIWELEPLRQLTRPLALALVVGYLLAPQPQSALLTEFHAAPLVMPLVLWSLWAVEARRWRQVVAAVVLVASVKEEMALLAAMLGLWAAWRSLFFRRPSAAPLQGVWRGGLLAAAGLAWFYVATFVIVPAHAVNVYGVAESSYFQRYGALGDSPLDIARSFFTQPQTVWAIATEPARLETLRGLLLPFGWLALLAPEVLLLGAPVLLANQLSAYPAQYYGEFHYSAPVLVYFAGAATFGLARLWRLTLGRLGHGSPAFQHLPAASTFNMALMALARNSRTALRPLAAGALLLWIVGWAGLGYWEAGRGPGGGRYDPTPITAHHRLLPRFTAQIPDAAAVTATAAVHPHVSHRRFVYQFPIGLEPPGIADWALLDVTTATDMAPGDVRSTVEAMLAGEWGVVDAADGFLLLRKGAPERTIPGAFYDFARTPGLPAPDAPLTLVDAEARDWPRWRATTIVTTWQVGAGFDSAQMAPEMTVVTPAGEERFRWAAATPPALVWYPPALWQPGDLVRVTTLPLYLPRAFGVVIAATPGLTVEAGGALVAAYRRDARDRLAALPTAVDAPLPMGWTPAPAAAFALPDGTFLELTSAVWPAQPWAGGPLEVALRWETVGAETVGAWPAGVSVFVHLRREGETQAQQDGAPRYFVPTAIPTAIPTAGRWADWRQMTVPPTADLGATWTVVVGLYDPATGARLPLADGAGDEVTLATLTLGPPPVPDQACALIVETCAAQGVE